MRKSVRRHSSRKPRDADPEDQRLTETRPSANYELLPIMGEPVTTSELATLRDIAEEYWREGRARRATLIIA